MTTALPRFSSEVINSFSSSVNNDCKLNIFQENVDEFWSKLEKDNPELADFVYMNATSYLNTEDDDTAEIGNPEAANAFLEGVHLVVSMIQRQNEVNELNEMFGE